MDTLQNVQANRRQIYTEESQRRPEALPDNLTLILWKKNKHWNAGHFAVRTEFPTAYQHFCYMW